jgi:hypothetical protein
VVRGAFGRSINVFREPLRKLWNNPIDAIEISRSFLPTETSLYLHRIRDLTLYPMNNLRSACLIAFCMLIAGFGASGCVSILGGAGNASGPGSGPVRASFIDQEPGWSVAKGCFWKATYQVYNSGDQPVKNVVLTVELLDTSNNAIRDSRSIFIGPLAPGQATTVTADLDGECTSEYVVRATPSFEP